MTGEYYNQLFIGVITYRAHDRYVIEFIHHMKTLASQDLTDISTIGSRPSAKDVARLAGVSTATVSRVLNTPDQVDVHTQDLVRQAVAKLRYVPHGVARALRSARSQMIGAVVPSFAYALYARTTSAMQSVLNPKGYSVVLAEHHYDLKAELRTTEQLIRHGVDAFVFVGLDHDPALFTMLENYGRPYVLTWGYDASGRHPSIGFDNRAAMFEMTQQLIRMGHTRFGLLSAVTQGNDRARERGAGVRAALDQAGLALPEDCAIYGAIDLGTTTRMMRQLLQIDPARRPTAVIGTNDIFAVGAMLACREAGVRIPDDISLTGCDDTDLGATQTPTLTSIRTPITEVGRAAAEQVIARLEGRPFQHAMSLPFEIVMRGSVSAPT